LPPEFVDETPAAALLNLFLKQDSLTGICPVSSPLRWTGCFPQVLLRG
jgi:hypothetical protein